MIASIEEGTLLSQELGNRVKELQARIREAKGNESGKEEPPRK